MNTFSKTLTSIHRTRLIGRVCLLILCLAITLATALLLHGLADYHFALSPERRTLINSLITGTLAILGLIWLARILRTPRSHTARLADTALDDPRSTNLSAIHLQEMEAATDMNRYHLEKALTQAGERLKKTPFQLRLPVKPLILALAVGLLIALTIFGIRSSAPDPWDIVSTRILSPSSPTPPYSPLRFTITPDTPSALYGGEALVQVHITGGEITEDVHCLLRDPSTGKITSSNTYREAPGKFARKFENSLVPLEFAFTTGRARSPWHRLDILLQPLVSKTEVLITPPAYTGLKPSTYPLDSGEIKALTDSTIQLSIESNRPLSAGLMTLTSMNNNEDTKPGREIEATVTGDNRVTFTWTASQSAQLSALIRDLRSTPAESPLQLTLTTIPDIVPQVEISTPQPRVLATPKSKLPFKGHARDDHGLSKVSLVRTLVGFRDRTRLLANSLVKKDYDYQEPLALEDLGVEPGQVLEFYLEATDQNPSLLGVGVSDLVRVQIISEEDYAERIRSQFELKKFTARYRALAEAVKNSRESLNDLEKAIASGDPKAIEAARKNAAETHKKAAELTQKIADDFKAFDLEGRLKEAAGDAAQKLKTNQQQLQKLNPNASKEELKKSIEEMKQRLGQAAQKSEQLQQDAEKTKKAGRVLEMAARYRKLLANQKSIAERMAILAEEVAKGNLNNVGRLEGLSRIQKENRNNLLKFAQELRDRSNDLPEDFAQMKTDVTEFLDALEEMNIPNPMDAASDAAARGKVNDAAANASLAHAMMERLLEKPKNGF